MFTVRVDATGLEPGVTDGSENEHVGSGDGPATEHVRSTGVSQYPFTEEIVITPYLPRRSQS